MFSTINQLARLVLMVDHLAYIERAEVRFLYWVQKADASAFSVIGGSIPCGLQLWHVKGCWCQWLTLLTLNQLDVGSNPMRPT
jgi:hypothetical protein